MSIRYLSNRFSIYEFFSIFLPGTTFLIGIAPFLPDDTPIGSAGLIIVLIIGGFVIGQAIHTAAIGVESLFEVPDHREVFISEFFVPTIIPFDLMQKFRSECEKEFDHFDFPYITRELDRRESYENSGKQIPLMDFSAHKSLENISDGEYYSLVSLYTLVQSHLYTWGGGRSRTFQSIYAFCRSMWIVTIGLAIAYILYGVLKSIDAFQNEPIYSSFIGGAGIPDAVIVLGSISAALLFHVGFREAKVAYKRNFVRYIVSDFLSYRNNRSMSNNTSSNQKRI